MHALTALRRSTLPPPTECTLRIRCLGVAALPSVTAITANLLSVSATREPADPHSCPAELGHEFRQTPKGPIALWDLEQSKSV